MSIPQKPVLTDKSYLKKKE